MALVLVNAAAGGGRAEALVAPLRDWLHRHHPAVPLVRTVSVGEARRVVNEAPRGSRVVLVGGDGTLHQLLPALLDGAHELALVPAGSGDDSARALGVRGLAWPRVLSRALVAQASAVDIGWVTSDAPVAAAAASVMTAASRAVETGSSESRPFFSSLCAGFDAAVAQRAAAGSLRRRGPARLVPRYLLATLGEVAHLRLHKVRIEADDELVHEGDVLFASALNTASYGGGMPAVPGARIDDGALDLLVAARFGRTGVLAMLPRLLLGRHLGHAQVRHRRFATLRILADAPLPLAADGEALLPARTVTVRVGARRLKVVRAAG